MIVCTCSRAMEPGIHRYCRNEGGKQGSALQCTSLRPLLVVVMSPINNSVTKENALKPEWGKGEELVPKE
jgi:hypothetical protein